MTTVLGKNILGYELTDILNVSGDALHGGLLNRLRHGVYDAAYIVKLRSRLLNDFFDRMNVLYNKKSLRRVLIYQTLLLAIIMIGTISQLPFGGYILSGIPLYGGYFLIGLLSMLTIYDWSSDTYIRLSFGFMTIFGLIILIHCGTVAVFLPIQYAIVMLYSFITYTQLPVTLSFYLVMQFLLYFGLTVLDTFKSKRGVVRDREGDIDSHLVAIITFYLFIPTTGLAIYLKTFLGLRFKASFLRVCQAVQMNAKQKKTLDQQGVWVDAVMPKKIRLKYWQMLRLNRDKEPSSWVFCETYDPVSILFSEIAGFHILLSTVSASKLLYVLNSLFSRFDNLCYNCSCERIGTFGSIYYCVCGCPTPKNDHAAYCANLALLMLDTVKLMRLESQVDLSLAIGIHTGSVNGALVGMDRFRFDIYSYSVLTAQKLMATCEPDQIHISERFYRLLPSYFKATPGEPIEEKREVQSALAGLKLQDARVETYYLDVNSERLISADVRRSRYSSVAVFRLDEKAISAKESIVSSRATTKYRRQSPSLNRRATRRRSDLGRLRADPYTKKQRPPNSKLWNADVLQGRKSLTIKEFLFGIPAEHQDAISQLAETKEMNAVDNEVIKEMHADSRLLASLFNVHILNPITLRFLDSKFEKFYQSRNENQSVPVYIDSLKLSPVFDIIFLYFYILGFTMAYIGAAGKEPNYGIGLSIFALLSANIFVLPCAGMIIYGVVRGSSEEANEFEQSLLQIIRSRIFIEIVFILLGQLPTLYILLFVNYIPFCSHLNSEHNFFTYYAPAAILMHCIPMDSSYVLRTLSACFSALLFTLSLFNANNGPAMDQRYEHAWFYDQSIFQPSRLTCLIMIIACCILVLLVTRRNDATSRLRFYMVREAEKSADITSRVIKEYNDFIYNVVPKYIVRNLVADGARTLNANAVNYAALVPQVGIAFIRLTNFFDGYYREDYQSGRHAIGVLNQIICLFDKHLRNPKYRDVEKLRTYNDSYMVASGLDNHSREQSYDQIENLKKLLRFCHRLFKKVKKFNKNFILGQDNAFELGIGVDTGTICSGLIGSAQPYYHLIGQPADVAYKLHLISPPGKIVVTDNVRVMLISNFEFEEVLFDNPPLLDQSYYFIS